MTKRKPSHKQIILKRLKAGPATGAELAALTSWRFGGRIGDLREDGHTITEHEDREGMSVYTLVAQPPAPALTTVVRPPAIPGWPDGRYVVCTYCSRAWDEDGSSQGCVCGKTAEWLLELHDERERDRIAARIDPAQVADRVAWANRFLDDREKAAA